MEQNRVRRGPQNQGNTDGQLLAHEFARLFADSPETIDESSFTGSWADATKEHVTLRFDKKPQGEHQGSCYICKMHINDSSRHPMLSFMCKPCGNFNIAGASLSLPDRLTLTGKTALVTGARINLDFHAALRLLRCGAKVIVTTRYPLDAFNRYRREADSEVWLHDRLTIVGADLRCAEDAFELVRQVRTTLSLRGDGKLDILINNAAQTLTDSEDKEKAAIAREKGLQATIAGSEMCPALQNHKAEYYLPRLRGGSGRAGEESTMQNLEFGNTMGLPGAPTHDGKTQSSADSESGEKAIATIPEKSSWVQTMSEIPYADVMTAHAVNTFVPLILIRELMPLMARTKGEGAAYIVNVSSREGVFERKPNHGAKSGHHVHTIMSKAGLNMITETEAAPAWANHRVAMNTVDPGYMSAAPEMKARCPLTWEDGAGRILWPIATAEGEDRSVVWGRFLKHYGAVWVAGSRG